MDDLTELLTSEPFFTLCYTKRGVHHRYLEISFTRRGNTLRAQLGTTEGKFTPLGQPMRGVWSHFLDSWCLSRPGKDIRVSPKDDSFVVYMDVWRDEKCHTRVFHAHHGEAL